MFLNRMIFISITIAILLADMQIASSQTQKPSYSIKGNTLGFAKKLKTEKDFGFSNFPDEAISLISKDPLEFVMVGWNNSYLMRGSSFKNANIAAKILTPGDKDSVDSGYAGISAMHFDKNIDEWIAFYHAEDHSVNNNPMKDVHGFYASVCMARSPKTDGDFVKYGAVITCNLPKKIDGRGDQGVGNPSVIAEPSGKYLYCYYTNWARDNDRRAVNICLARCDIDDAYKTDGWFKYNNGSFSQPGIGGKESPVVESPVRGDAWTPSVTYIPEWKKYIMLVNITAIDDFKLPKPKYGGIYYASSDDGINWTVPKQLITAYGVQVYGGKVAQYGALVVDKIDANTLTGSIIYASSDSWSFQPGHGHVLTESKVKFIRYPTAK